MATLTLQPDKTAGIDTFLDKSNPNTNSGSDTKIGVSDLIGAFDREYRALIKFDLSSLVGATITSATLTLTEYDESGNPETHYAIYRILAANSGWTQAGATWNKLDGTNNWAGSAGCDTSGTDYSATPLWGPGNPGFAHASLDFSLDATEFTEMVGANYGLIFKNTGAGTINTYRFYRSSNYSDTDLNKCPKLVVEYTPPSTGVSRIVRPSAPLAESHRIAGGVLVN